MILRALLALLLVSLTSLAQVYQFNYSVPWSGPGIGLRNYAGVVEKISSLYVESSNHFEWDVEFSPSPAGQPIPGLLPNSFWLVVNNGPMPKFSSQGEVPIIHFDGTDPANPVISVYAYTGSNSGGSWFDGSNQLGTQDPDRILSNIAPVGPRNPPGWVKEILVQDVSPNRRRMRFAIDATAIQNHVPKYGSTDTPGCDVNPTLCWEGLKFGPFPGDANNSAGNYIGVWFHPFADLSSTYFNTGNAGDPDRIGFISSWNTLYEKRGWYDTGSRYPGVFIVSPTCEKNDLYFTAIEGLEFTHEAFVSDPAGGGATLAYSGFPPSMVFDPTAGSIAQNGDRISYTWTPLESEVGTTYKVGTMLLDRWGSKGGCGFAVRAEPNGAPKGGFQGSITPIPCSGSRVSQRLSLNVEDDGIPNKILSYTWSTDCPNATLSDAGGTIQGHSANLVTEVTLDAEVNNLPSSCTVTASVSDGLKTRQFVAPVTVATCVKDCRGMINGEAQFDICNVCEGDGTSCLDCEGTPFGSVKVDRCNVCGGNGDSCLGCDTYDVSRVLATLDTRANQQRRLITRIANLIRSSPGSTVKSRRIATLAVVEAKKLEILQWQSLWVGFGASGQVCQNTSFCAQSSNLDLLGNLVNNSDSLRRLANRLVSRTSRDGTASNLRRVRWTRLNKKLHSQNVSEIGSLPEAKSFCSSESFGF